MKVHRKREWEDLDEPFIAEGHERKLGNGDEQRRQMSARASRPCSSGDARAEVITTGTASNHAR